MYWSAALMTFSATVANLLVIGTWSLDGGQWITLIAYGLCSLFTGLCLAFHFIGEQNGNQNRT